MQDLPIGYIGLSQGHHLSRGPPTNCLVRIESMADIWSFTLNVVKHLHLGIHEIQFYSTCRVITPEPSNEFLWISMSRFVKPHANYCVDILKAFWRRPAFVISNRLLREILPKKIVAVHFWNAYDQWPNWRVEVVRTGPLCQA